MKMGFKLLGILGAGFICFCIFMLGGYMLHEGYNPVSPRISTKYTDQYDEMKFDETEGMDTTDVIKLIGQPFRKDGSTRSVQAWSYTQKGNCKWNEFAWLGRYLVIDRYGKVKAVKKVIRYE